MSSFRSLLVLVFLVGGLSQVAAAEKYKPQILFSMKTSVFGPPAEAFVDKNENLYLLSASKPLVHVYDKAGQRIAFFNWKGAVRPRLKVNEQGNILISSEEAGKSWVYDLKGKLLKEQEFASPIERATPPKMDQQYHFVRVQDRDKEGNVYALYHFEKDKAIYHFQVTNTEYYPPYRTYKFDKNLKCIYTFDSPVLFEPVSERIYGFRPGVDGNTDFLKWVTVP